MAQSNPNYETWKQSATYSRGFQKVSFHKDKCEKLTWESFDALATMGE